MTKRETARERQAREAEAAMAIRLQWEAEKPLRLLKALARAQDLGLDTELRVKGDDIFFSITSEDCASCHMIHLSDLTAWQMQSIEQDLDEREEERARKLKLREIRKGVLSRLTDEEKEALGLD